MFQLHASDLLQFSIVSFSHTREIELFLAAVVFLFLAYNLFLELGVLVCCITHQRVLTLSELHKKTYAYLRAHFLELLEALVAARQRHGDVFALSGSFPTAPGIISVMLFGGATISAVVCESDFESVQTDLIVEFQCVRDRQIEHYFSRLKREAEQRCVDELEQKKREARRKAKMTFEDHAIAQRNYANPHLHHCPLRTQLRAACACYPPASSPSSDEICRTYLSPRKPSPFQYGRGSGYAKGPSGPAAHCQPHAPIAGAATKQPRPFSAEESEAALAKFRAGLNIPDPRTSPQVNTEPFTYNWTIWHYPEVREHARNLQAQNQSQSQGLWHGNQPSFYPTQPNYATGYQENPHPANNSTFTLPCARNTGVLSAAPNTSANPASSAAPTQPTPNAHAPPPNGVTPFTMTHGNNSSAPAPFQPAHQPPVTTMGPSSTSTAVPAVSAPPQGPAPGMANSATNVSSGPTPPQGQATFTTPTGAANPFSSASSLTQAQPAPATTTPNPFASASTHVQAPATVPGAKPVIFASVGPAYPDAANNPFLNLEGKTPKDKKVKELMLELFRPWRKFDRNAPTTSIKNLKFDEACQDLLKITTVLHQYTAPAGVWKTGHIGEVMAASCGFKGLEWQHIRKEFGAFVQMSVNSPGYHDLQAAWMAFHGLDQIIPLDVVGLTYEMVEDA